MSNEEKIWHLIENPLPVVKTKYNNEVIKPDFKVEIVEADAIKTEYGEEDTSSDGFTCPKCHAHFLLSDTFVKHIKEHDNLHFSNKLEKSDKDKCISDRSSDKRRKNEESGLEYRLINNTDEKTYKCEVCSRSFAQKSHLTEHTRTHTGEKPFKCELCSQFFSQKSALTRHRRTQTGEKPFKCQSCSQSFAQRSGLVTHSRTHTGEKLYKCKVCSKAFTRKASLTDHTRTHTGEKPFRCELCSKSFPRKKT